MDDDAATLRAMRDAAKAELDAARANGAGRVIYRSAGNAVPVPSECDAVSAVYSVDTRGRTVELDPSNEAFLAVDRDSANRHLVEEVVLSTPAETRVRTLAESAGPAANLKLFVKSDPLGNPRALCNQLDNAEPSELTTLLLERSVAGAVTVPKVQGLSSEQAAAVADSLAPGLNVVWGPPGTGKTEVLGHILAGLVHAGKSVLLASNTNVAVDGALLRAAQKMGKALQVGHLVRTGAPALAAVNDHPYLRVEKAAAAISKSLRNELADVERAIVEGEQAVRSQLKRLGESEAKRRLEAIDVPAVQAAAARRLLVEERDAARARADEAEETRASAHRLDLSALAEEQHARGRMEAARPAAEAHKTLAEFQNRLAVAHRAVSRAREAEQDAEGGVADAQASLAAARALGWWGRRKAVYAAEQRLANQEDQRVEAAAARQQAEQEAQQLDATLGPQRVTLTRTADQCSVEDIRRREAALVAAVATLSTTRRALAAAVANRDEAAEALRRIGAVPDLTEHEMALSAPKLVAEIEDLNRVLDRAREVDAAWSRDRTRQLKERKSILDALGNQSRQVVRDARVVATTTAGLVASGALEEARRRVFDVVVVDEASAVPLPQLTYLSTLAREGMTVVGDHLQNGPICQTRHPSPRLKPLLQHDVFVYLRLNRTGTEPRPGFRALTTQHRFPRGVAEVVNDFAYGAGKLDTADEDVKAFHPLAGLPTQPVVVMDVCNLPGEMLRVRGDGGKAGAWLAGAAVTAELARRIPRDSSLGVVVPYALQSSFTQDALLQRGLHGECGTSYRFQGREFDVVCFDTTEPLGHKGWLWEASFSADPTSWPYSGARLANVALTRTRGQVFIVADTRTILQAPAGSFFAELLKARDKGHVGRADAWAFLQRASPPQGGAEPSTAHEILAPHNEDVRTSGRSEVPAAGTDSAPTAPRLVEAARRPRLSEPSPAASAASIVLTAREMYADLPRLLEEARETVEIYSPCVAEWRLSVVLPHLEECVSRGVRVIVRCKPHGEIDDGHTNAAALLARMESAGITVKREHGMGEKLLILDQTVGYVGSLNLLSFGGNSREVMMRVEETQLKALNAATQRQ